jgi:biopolymer transport protein ExbB
MADTKPTATAATAAAARSISSVQPKRSRNSVSWLAPLTCIILGYVIWRFVVGKSWKF